MGILRHWKQRGTVGIPLALPAFLVISSLLWGLTTTAQAAMVELIPSSTQIQTGRLLTVEVRVSGLGNLAPPSLGAFDLTLDFDPGVLGYESTSIDTGLGDPGQGEAIVGINPGTGEVNVFAVSLLTPAQLNDSQADSFRIFSVTFKALAKGSTALGLTASAFGNQLGEPEALGEINEPTVSVRLPVAPRAVPGLSPLGLLLLIGLLMAFGWRRLRGARP